MSIAYPQFPRFILLLIWGFACGYFSSPLLATLFLGPIDSGTILKFFLGILGVLILPKKIWPAGFAWILGMSFLHGLNWIFERFWETLQLPQGPAPPSVGEIAQIALYVIYFLLFLYLFSQPHQYPPAL